MLELVQDSVQQLSYYPVILETPRLLQQSGTAHGLEIL
jgi:hypothetical protein